jgi:polyisoprenoid-binding protein YceI
MMKTKLIPTLILAALSSSTHAATVFDFEDPKGVNNIRFDLDAPLEAISGTGNGISGSITFDIENPAATSGRIVLQTASLMVPNSTMREHLHGSNWLNAEANPEIVFEAVTVEVKAHNDNRIDTHVTGNLTLNGVTREITVPVSFTHLPDRLGDRTGGRMQGDLLVVRSQFTVNRSDYNIRKGQNLDTVAETIELSMAVAGAAPR